jgi:hypothetical protein
LKGFIFLPERQWMFWSLGRGFLNERGLQYDSSNSVYWKQCLRRISKPTGTRKIQPHSRLRFVSDHFTDLNIH